MTMAHRNAVAVCSSGVPPSPLEWSLSAGPALWRDNDSPALQMPPRCALKRGASRLITMTMGMLRARGALQAALDTTYEMTEMTFSSQMETGGFDFLKCRQMDGVTASLSKLLGGPPFLAFSFTGREAL